MAPTDQAKPTSTDKLMTPANIVTLARICLVPVFVVVLISPWPQWLGLPQVADDAKSLIAAGIFILISCTDWLDGYLARSRGEVTDFGKFMDPLADKILVAAALLALIELGSLPSWVALVILAREFIVSGVRMVAASEGVVIAASWYGKFKTVFQMAAIVLFCVKDSYMVGSLNAALSDWLWLAELGGDDNRARADRGVHAGLHREGPPSHRVRAQAQGRGGGRPRKHPPRPRGRPLRRTRRGSPGRSRAPRRPPSSPRPSMPWRAGCSGPRGGPGCGSARPRALPEAWWPPRSPACRAARKRCVAAW